MERKRGWVTSRIYVSSANWRSRLNKTLEWKPSPNPNPNPNVVRARLEPGLFVHSLFATRAGTLTSETILRPGSNNFSVRVRARVWFPFKLLIQPRTPVSGRNIEKQLVRILYMIPGDGGCVFRCSFDRGPT